MEQKGALPCGTAQAAASQGFEQIRNYVETM